MEYRNSELFNKDLERLAKRFPTLLYDIETAKRSAIEVYHVLGLDNQSVFAIPGFQQPALQIFKLRKFACKSLKGRGNRSGIRIIYAYHPETNAVEFIEIYFKVNQENEDRDRLQSYIQGLLASQVMVKDADAAVDAQESDDMSDGPDIFPLNGCIIG